MDDRELLEAAAKAADIPHGADRIDCGLSLTNADGRHTSLPQWNPLTDDGDALRLAVKLHIDIRHFMYRSNYMDCLVDRLGKGFAESTLDDPYAATRRAIVRAAAAIGEQK
jgi:hypothetical protein